MLAGNIDVGKSGQVQTANSVQALPLPNRYLPKTISVGLKEQIYQRLMLIIHQNLLKNEVSGIGLSVIKVLRILIFMPQV